MITIRNAGKEDFAQLIELFREFATFERMPEKMTNSVERMVVEKELFHSFVAETMDGQIVGYATYFFSYHTWIGKSLYIDDLFVKEEYRGKGIGTSLMKRTIDYAKESGCHKMRWQVSNWNSPAINFYKSLGAQIGTTEQNCDLVLRG
jgi:GNAT superfamily N-acetyltransferase